MRLAKVSDPRTVQVYHVHCTICVSCTSHTTISSHLIIVAWMIVTWSMTRQFKYVLPNAIKFGHHVGFICVAISRGFI